MCEAETKQTVLRFAAELILGGSMQGNTFLGPFPPEIILLSGLQVLDLGPNAFSGVIPSEVGNLVGLRKCLETILNCRELNVFQQCHFLLVTVRFLRS